MRISLSRQDNDRAGFVRSDPGIDRRLVRLSAPTTISRRSRTLLIKQAAASISDRVAPCCHARRKRQSKRPPRDAAGSRTEEIKRQIKHHDRANSQLRRPLRSIMLTPNDKVLIKRS